MATVRRPSSVAARKMRMAISLRLAASSLRIGLCFFIESMAYDVVSASRKILHCFMNEAGMRLVFWMGGRRKLDGWEERLRLRAFDPKDRPLDKSWGAG